ncbi:MAG: outer membrane efflux protein [Elusimicrobia bacterium]|nr:MAG: outer membrane efflux protein [Elusimicrobiota bacterium]KAF0158168.1 MAG: outer membrane efflux protein [Elusimicrobiota bacterium]
MLRSLLILALLPAAADALQVLTFDEARGEMIAANPRAQASARNLETAGERLTAARAGLYPYFSASAAYSRSGSQGLAPGDSYSYGFSGSQPLFSPSVPAAVRSAEASYRSAAAAHDGLLSRLGYDLKAAFAGILNAREALALSEATLKRREENLELIRLKYEAGRENKAALLETEAALKTARWRHERYRKELLLLERGLNRLLGRGPREPVPGLSLPEPPAPPAELSPFESRLREHPSLRAARAAVDSAEASADSARAGRLPEASANGSYRWSGTDWPDRNSAWSLGASVSLPLFAGGRLKAGVAAARSGLASAEADLRNASDEIHLSAEDAFLSWREAAAWLDVAKSSLDAAEARAWLVRKQYLAGQTSYFEWRTVEDSLITEQNDYLSAGRALALAHAAFVRALGE